MDTNETKHLEEQLRRRAEELEKLLTKLLERRSRVRELIEGFKDSSRNPFVNWKEAIN